MGKRAAGAVEQGAATRFWARHELGARWRSLVVLGLLAGIAGGVAAAAIDGAARTDTAYTRFRAATAAPDEVVFGTQVGSQDADYSVVARLPEVADSGSFNLASIGLAGYPRLSTLAPSDSHLYRTLSRPLLRDGRLPDPRRRDEIFVNREAARRFHFHVGQAVTIVSHPTLDAFYGQAPMTGGPSVRAHIVGIGDSSMDLLFGPNDPSFVVSGAFLERYGDHGPTPPEGKITAAPNLVVRLRPGADVRRFHEDVARVLHLRDQEGHLVAGRDIPIRDTAEDNKRVEHATDLERTGLLLFAAAVALAGLMLVGQAIARVVFAMGDVAPALRALGFVRRQLVGAMVLTMLPMAAVGAATSVVVAVALSSRFPVGLAGRLDPERGIQVDAVVLLAGAIVVAILATAIALGSALRATSPRRSEVDRHASRLAAAVRASAPPAIGIGAGLALERGRGERSLPVRFAIVGGVVAVVGVIASLGLLHGIDDALHEPTRSGQVWDAQVFPDSPAALKKVEAVAKRDPSVGAIGVLQRAPFNVGRAGLPVYTVDEIRGHRPFTVLSGRAPAGTHEVLIGPATARALHLGIGDRTAIVAGGHRPVQVTVVGTGLLPQDPHSSFDQGAWVAPEGWAAITGGRLGGIFENADIGVVVAFHRSVPVGAAVDRLHRLTGAEVDERTLPQDVLLLRDVRTLPANLAIFLVLLGIAALAHALVTAVRRRRHDIAVLRTLGFTPRQAALCIASQASTIGVISLVIGIPLGVVAGQLAWRWVADATPLLYVPPTAVLAVVLVIPATVICANLLAAWPAKRASGIRPADVFRTDAPAA
ncbi:MAG TPA: FtsX-like permease family protein [Acidimicrobiia bacterium]